MNQRWSRLQAVIVAATLAIPMLGSTASAQGNRDNHGNFYNGARHGGQGGNYGRYPNNGRDPRYGDRYQGHGVGTGTGALIGGGGGAALGALFGGGMKGALIGGAAGAGIGAIVGHKHQQNMKRDYYRDRGRPY